MPWINSLAGQITLLSIYIRTTGVFSTGFLTIKTTCMYLIYSVTIVNQSVILFLRNIKHMNLCGPIRVTQLLPHLNSNIWPVFFPNLNTISKHVKCSMIIIQEHSNGILLNNNLKVWSILISANAIQAPF